MTKPFKLLTELTLLSGSLNIQAKKARRHIKKLTKAAVVSAKSQYDESLTKWDVPIRLKTIKISFSLING